MDQKNTLIRYISQTLTLFGVNILILLTLAKVFGDKAKSVSSLYQFGSSGLATSTILQFLLSSAILIALKDFFFSERIFKKMMTLWRTIFMLFSVFFVHVLLIYIFGWFSFENTYGWIGFILCFFGSCTLGALAMILKTKLESKQYDELLDNYKYQQRRDKLHE